MADEIPRTSSDEEQAPDSVPTSAPAQAPVHDGLADGQSEWARPVSQARDRNVGAWLLLVSAVCFAFAFRQPANRLYWQLRNRFDGPEKPVERTADSFLALSYEAVSATPDAEGLFTPAERFREHLSALRDAGYHPIGLDDVRAFYRDGAKLPAKAVLVTFENTHKNTYFDASPVLRSLHWRGVIGVVTSHVRENSPDSILAPYLRNMVLDDTWDLACESDLGTTLVPSGPVGGESLFLSTPAWLAAEKRPEKPEEFEKRVRADHERAVKVFEETLGEKPLAFFFPSGNYGQYGDRNRVMRGINLSLVEEMYGLGFLLGSRALNTAGADPRRLNRLRVAPEWTAASLLARLEREWPVAPERGAGRSRVQAERWSADWGLADVEGSVVRIHAIPAANPALTDDDATGGARAWIAGSDGFSEGSVEMRFVPLRGEFHAYVPFAADDEWVRIELSETGNAAVRICSPGSEPRLVSSGGVSSVSDFRSVHSLFATVRDGLLFVRLDSELLFGGPVELPGKIRPGLVGAGVWADVPGLAQADMLETHLRPRTDGIVTWPPALSRDEPRLALALRRDSFRYAAISPPWFDAHEGAPVSFPHPDSETLSVIAHSCRARIMPRVILHDTGSLLSLDPNELADLVASEKANGVFVDADEFPSDRLPRLREWANHLHAALSRHSLGLAVRLPATVRSLAAASTFINSLEGVSAVSGDGGVPPGVDPARGLALLNLEPPAQDDGVELFYQLSGFASESSGDDESAGSLRERGLRAYSEGRYAEAATHWKHWTEETPNSPEAWALLGNAQNRMFESESAVESYARSLKLAPGQLDVALESARLLERLGRDKEAGDLLDTYARAFPGDTRIAVAQALWLDRHQRRSDGRAIMRDIVARDPADITSRLTLQSLLDDPAERYQNMHQLLKVGASGPSGTLGFGHDIERAELLSCFEAGVFFDFVRNAATNAPQEAVRNLYSGFLPLSEPIIEPFDASSLSTNWIALGTSLGAIAGAYDLKAETDMSEAYLRLRRSELLRDGFIEVTLSESVGAFWLYARRSSRSLVRFGFDGDGFLRVQSWLDGEIRTGDSRAWLRPGGDVTLRLEVRGDGAIGLVDGKPAFATPLPIPRNIAYGWWSVAPFSPELGVARARITRISAGPLASTLAFIRETDVERTADALDALRPRSREISALSPVLFAQYQDGTIPTIPLADLMPYRMFCSYHRIRLMPSVALDYDSHIDPVALVGLISKHRLAGIVLHMRSMPSEEWFRKTTQLLESTTADLVVVVSSKPLLPPVQDATPRAAEARLSALEPVVIREIQRGSLITHTSRNTWTVKPTSVHDWPTFGVGAETAEPILVVVPSVASDGEAEEPEEDAADAAPAAAGEKGEDGGEEED